MDTNNPTYLNAPALQPERQYYRMNLTLKFLPQDYAALRIISLRNEHSVDSFVKTVLMRTQPETLSIPAFIKYYEQTFNASSWHMKIAKGSAQALPTMHYLRTPFPGYMIEHLDKLIAAINPERIHQRRRTIEALTLMAIREA